MKTSIILSTCCIYLAILTSITAGPTRFFVDRQGRIIEAELISHAGVGSGKLTIRKGSKEFDVKLSIFGEKDQAFIREWMKKTPAKKKAPAKIHYSFEISEKKKKITKDYYVYDLAIENLADNPVTNFKITYLVFCKNSMGKIVSKGDSIEVTNPVKKGQTAKLSTKLFDPDALVLEDETIIESISPSDWWPESERKRGGRASLVGVLVRIHDADGNLVADWRSGGSQFKGNWPRPKTANSKPEKPQKPKVTIE